MKSHMMSGCPTYQSWMGMKRRCTYPKHVAYHLYGGRGIHVHPPWLNSFETFLQDMGERPEGTSLDRIDNDGDYTPDNCRWADKYTQANNRSSSTAICLDGVTKTIAEWARLHRLKYITVKERLRRGWTIRDALTMPPNRLKVTIDGKTKWMADFAREYGLEPGTVTARIRQGMSIEDAITTPLMDTTFKPGHTFWDDFKAEGRTRKPQDAKTQKKEFT